MVTKYMKYMNSMKKVKFGILLSLIYINYWSYSMVEIEYARIIRSYDTPKARLFHDNDGSFYILNNDSFSKIKDLWIDLRLRGIKEQDLNLYLKGNYIKITQLNNGEITLSRHQL